MTWRELAKAILALPETELDRFAQVYINDLPILQLPTVLLLRGEHPEIDINIVDFHPALQAESEAFIVCGLTVDVLDVI